MSDSSFTGKEKKDTYGDILHIDNDNTGLDSTLRTVYDGIGHASPMQVSTSSVKIGNTTLSGSIIKVSETTLPSTPVSGQATLWVNTSDHHPYILDSTGTSTDLLANQSTITLSGDTSGSGVTSITTTIGGHTVSYPKMQQVTKAHLLGNPTTSTADVSEISIDSTLLFTGTTLGCAGGIGLGSVLDGASENGTAAIFDTTNSTAAHLKFNGVSAADTTITIAGGGNNSPVTVKVNPANITITDLSGAGTAATHPTAYFLQTANNLSDGVAVTMRSNLGLGTSATHATGDFLQTANNLSDGVAATMKTNLSLNNVENTALSTWAGTTNITTLGTIATGTWSASTIALNKGGTGQTTATAAFDALSPVTTLGDTIYRDGSNNVRLAGNITSTKKFLRQTGNGAVSAAPAWDTVTSSDVGLGNVENTALSTWAGTTNITTIGTIAMGTWSATTIALNKGGTGQTTATAAFDALAPTTTQGDLIYRNASNNVRLAAGSANNVLLSGGAGANPAWSSGTFSGSSSGTNTGDQTITLSTDASGSGTGTVAVTLAQPLHALVAYNTNGLLTQTAQNTFTGRTVTGTANEITSTNGDGVSGNPIISLPTALTFTGKTVTNGTFTTPTINVNDNVLSIRDNGDTSKIVQFECSGISTGTTRTLTVPDKSGTIATTADITGTNSGTNTGDQNIFQTIAVSGQSSVVADTTTDTLTLVAGTNVTITTNATTDTITITASGGSGSVSEAEIDFGSSEVSDASFTVTDATVSTSSKIIVGTAGTAPSDSRDVEEIFAENYQYMAAPGTGQFTLYASPNEGTTSGKVKIWYSLG